MQAFLLQDIRGALVAGEQVRAVLGADERLQRVDAGEQADEIVLAAEREHRVDQVVADAGFALLDLEAVGEEVEKLDRDSCSTSRSRVARLRQSDRAALMLRIEIACIDPALPGHRRRFSRSDRVDMPERLAIAERISSQRQPKIVRRTISE